MIEHVPDQFKLLKEVWRILKPYGYMLISTPNGFNIHPDGCEHVRAYFPNGFLADLELSGFNVIDKRGNVPNVHLSLLPMARGGMTNLLDDFKQIAEKLANFKDSYYVGSQLFVLVQKKGKREEWLESY